MRGRSTSTTRSILRIKRNLPGWFCIQWMLPYVSSGMPMRKGLWSAIIATVLFVAAWYVTLSYAGRRPIYTSAEYGGCWDRFHAALAARSGYMGEGETELALNTILFGVPLSLLAWRFLLKRRSGSFVICLAVFAFVHAAAFPRVPPAKPRAADHEQLLAEERQWIELNNKVLDWQSIFTAMAKDEDLPQLRGKDPSIQHMAELFRRMRALTETWQSEDAEGNMLEVALGDCSPESLAVALDRISIAERTIRRRVADMRALLVSARDQIVKSNMPADLKASYLDGFERGMGTQFGLEQAAAPYFESNRKLIGFLQRNSGLYECKEGEIRFYRPQDQASFERMIGEVDASLDRLYDFVEGARTRVQSESETAMKEFQP
jgi:hypothetical protein